jgi:hypothetical protein
MKSRTLRLPENIFEALCAAAQSEGLTPSDWLALHLLHPKANGQGESEVGTDDWLDECIVTAPQTVGASNKQIDRDLVLAYAGKEIPPAPSGRG